MSFHYLLLRLSVASLFPNFIIVPGSPLSIVAVSLIVTGTEVNAANNCWLTTKHGVIYWAFAAPVATVITVSTLFQLMAVRYAVNLFGRELENIGQI